VGAPAGGSCRCTWQRCAQFCSVPHIRCCRGTTSLRRHSGRQADSCSRTQLSAVLQAGSARQWRRSWLWQSEWQNIQRPTGKPRTSMLHSSKCRLCCSGNGVVVSDTATLPPMLAVRPQNLRCRSSCAAVLARQHVSQSCCSETKQGLPPPGFASFTYPVYYTATARRASQACSFPTCTAACRRRAQCAWACGRPRRPLSSCQLLPSLAAAGRSAGGSAASGAACDSRSCCSVTFGSIETAAGAARRLTRCLSPRHSPAAGALCCGRRASQ